MHDDDYTNYRCGPCDRDFNSRRALYDHCGNAAVHYGQWCGRCERLFVNQAAREGHVSKSKFHRLCWYCDVDCVDSEERDDHMFDFHFQCLECSVRETSSRRLSWHMEDAHHYCSLCERFFGTENNLRQVGGGEEFALKRDRIPLTPKDSSILFLPSSDALLIHVACHQLLTCLLAIHQHQKIHVPRNLQCYGCDRYFATTSAMMIHLESGTCDCGIDRHELDRLAYKCYQSRDYTNGWNDYYRYRCPHCDFTFRFVSGLFQHVESEACNQRLVGTSLGKLEHFISIRV